MVFPELCVAAQLDGARRLGATLRFGEAVLSVQRSGTGIEVTTTQGRFMADRVVMAAGPWLPALLGSAYTPLLRVFRQVLHWFPTDSEAYAPERCPVYLWMHGTSEEDYFYGFPKLAGSAGIKVASERYALTTTPDAVDRHVAPIESTAMFDRHIRGRLRDVGAQAAKASACLYTVTPDSGFLIDALPEIPGVVLASACSGHGFKHSAALGECIAQGISGNTGLDTSLSAFGLGRFRQEAA